MSPITLEQAMMTLEGTGPVLEVAHEVSEILRNASIRGGIVGGVAVSLHGYLRTTVDVDVFVESDAVGLGRELTAHGFTLDSAKRQFEKRGVPVHIVTVAETKSAPRQYQEVRGIRTVSLADLINMKLRSGISSLLRAKDLGDAIGLIRHHRLTKDFTPQIDKALRDEFRKVVSAIEREAS